MTKRLIGVAATVLLLVGGLAGASVQKFMDTRHRQARAVMTLAQIHLNRLQRAVEARDCQAADRERDTLDRIKAEIDQAFSSAYAQDPEFRSRSDALRSAVAREDAPAAGVGACLTGASTLNAARLACGDCHNEYR